MAVAATPASRTQGRQGRQGRYDLVAEIARGGMGIVFRAYDRLARREVAYKRLYVENEAVRARCAALFEREYAALAQLSHPNIVQVYEYGLEADEPFYTMELLTGEGLRDAAPLSMRDTCALVRDVASALGLVHARRLVHRDVSPANVRVGPDGRGKLLDFGALAKFGAANDVVGTPPFLAPECLTTCDLDARTDLFSLGAVAYWGLTGRAPFPANSLDARRRNLTPNIQPPSAHVPEIPPKLDALVLSLLHHDPRARPASAAEVMDRLTTIADLPPEQNERQVAISYVTHPAFVGRSETQQSLRKLLPQTAASRTTTAVIDALPGLGRTALFDQIAIDAQLAGCTVLRAQGGAHARPFGLALSLVRAGSTIHPEVGPPPASVWPVVAGDASAGQAASPVEAVQRHERAVAGLQLALSEIGRLARLVILVDDAHRADAESLAVLASLAHAATDTATAILLSVTTAAAQEPNAALARLMRKATRVSLTALSADHIWELVESLFGSVPNARRLARWLHERSQGRPAACMDLIRMLLHQDMVHYGTGTFSLPHDLDESVTANHETAMQLGRTQHLSSTARSVAQLLSIQDVSMTFDMIAAATELDDRSAVLALDELRASGIIHSEQDNIALASESVRHAIASTLDDVSRRALHLQTARALNARYRDDASVMLLVGANLMRGGDETAGVHLLTRALRRRWFDPDRDATPVPLLEAVLEAMRKQGRTDAQCVAILVPLVRAGFSADYLVQLRHIDRALVALSNLCGIALAHRLRPRFGPKASLFMALGFAAVRFMLTPRSRRLPSFREAMIALLTIATAGAAAAVSALDSKKAREILDKLQPLEAFPEGTAPNVSYQFALAAYEVGSGKTLAGAERYAKLMTRLEQGPVPGLDPEARVIFRLGCLYGQAQAELFKGSRKALNFADRLQGCHPFYEPHVESTRMAYFALRGESDRADLYRERAELAALRGGMSWSSVTVVTVRHLYACCAWRNPMGLVQLIPELKRLARGVPNLELYCEIARANLELLRGQSEEAIRMFEQIFTDPRHSWQPTAWIDRTMYAQALSQAGRFEDAVRVLTDVLSHAQDHRDEIARYRPVQQLALAEAALGRFDSAVARMEDCLRELSASDHPLYMGSAHRDRARVALLAGDDATFKEHLRAMVRHFHSTKNPWLIRQCEQLAAQALKAQPVFDETTEDVFETVAASQALTNPATCVTRVLGNDTDMGGTE